MRFLRQATIALVACLTLSAVAVYGGEVQYVLVGDVVQAQPVSVVAAPSYSAPPTTRTVLVRECYTDANGRQTCRMVPRTEYVSTPAVAYSAPIRADNPAAIEVLTQTTRTTGGIVWAKAPGVTAGVDCPCVAALGSCPCSSSTAFSGFSTTGVVTQSFALPRVHAVRSWFADRPRFFPRLLAFFDR